MPVYYAQMSRLHETGPQLHAHFQIGGFSIQLRNTNPLAKIAVDQTTEETVNKDTHTSGGTRGFSLRQGNQRWQIPRPPHASAWQRSPHENRKC